MPDHDYTLEDLKRLEGDDLKAALITVLQMEDTSLFNRYQTWLERLRKERWWEYLGHRIDLNGIDLKYKHLRYIDLHKTNLEAADLRYSDFSFASFENAIMRHVDLSRADLRGANFNSASLVDGDLSRADLTDAKVRHTNLEHANLIAAIFVNSDLTAANLSSANLRNVSLRDAEMRGSGLRNADCRGAQLEGVNFYNADLRHTDLRATKLQRANLQEARLTGADFAGAQVFKTIFSNVDLSEVLRLEQAEHNGPSTIGIDTLVRSQGNIPESFMRGCGVSDTVIAFARSLVAKPIEFYSCFISYSSKDEAFAKLLYDTLQGQGVRCWYAPEQILPGERIDEAIDAGIRYWDKVLFCASKSSLTEKWWVDFEVDKALKKARDLQRKRRERVGVIIPLNLDGYLLSDDYNDARRSIFEMVHAPDFVGWQHNLDKFNQSVQQVIKALRTDGGKEAPPPSRI